MSELTVLLPGYNVARHLGELVPTLREHLPEAEILLVDDGSADGTAHVATELGRQVEIHAENRGKGMALRTGFAAALARGTRAVITMDADGQHLASEAHRFVEIWREGADVVVGNRMAATESMPWLRKRTNEFTSRVISQLAGTPIPDSQNGYRLFDAAVLRAVELESERYDLESEILIKAAALGFRVASVPVSTVYGDEVSAIHPVADTIRFARLVSRAGRWKRHPGERTTRVP